MRLSGIEGVVIHIGAAGEGRDPDFTEFRLSIVGEAITASSIVVDLRGGFLGFMTEVADDWKGRGGDRAWESAEHDLRVDAHRDMSGHVELVFTLRGGIQPWQQPAWCASATVPLDAGEELAGLVGALRDLFRRR